MKKPGVIPLFLAVGLLLSGSLANQTIWDPEGVEKIRGIRIEYSSDCDGTVKSHWETALTIWKFASVCLDRKDKSEQVESILDNLADQWDRPELKHAPFITTGFSWSSGHAWGTVKGAPDRAIAAVISGIGFSIPEHTLKVPMAYVINEGDNFEVGNQIILNSRRNGGFHSAWARFNGFHNWDNSNLITHLFFDECIRLRLPPGADPSQGPVELFELEEENGWIGFRDKNFKSANPVVMPFAGYSGDGNNTFWFPNENIARAWQGFNQLHDGLYDPSQWMFLPNFSFGPYYHEPTSPTFATIIPAWTSGSPYMRDFGKSNTMSIAYRRPTPVDRIEIYDGEVLIQTSTNPPHITSGRDLSPGYHPITGRAYPKGSSEVWTSILGVQGINPTHDLEIRLLEPQSWDRPKVGENVTVSTWINSPTYPVTKTELYVNGTVVESKNPGDGNFTWTPATTGYHTLKVGAENQNGDKMYSWSVRVFVPEPSKASALLVTPNEIWVKPGESYQLKAEIRDQYHRVMDTNPAVEWQTETGTISNNGLFQSSEKGGPFTITAKSGGMEDKSIVYVSNRIRINFQPPFTQTPAGFMADSAQAYGDRGNGYTFGWYLNEERGSLTPDGPRHQFQRATHPDFGVHYNSFIPMDYLWEPPHNKRETENTWEIEIPNGEYEVRAVMGDAYNQDIAIWTNLPQTKPDEHIYKLQAEDVLLVDGQPAFTEPFVEGIKKVTVSDGKLTLANAPGQNWNKIAFVEIIPPDDQIGIVVPTLPVKKTINAGARMIGRNLLVNLTGKHPWNIHLFTTDGKLAWAKNQSSSGEFSFNLSGLPKGTYFLRMTTQGFSLKNTVSISH